LDIIRLGEGNSISNGKLNIQVRVKETSREEPPQVTLTEAEKRQLRVRLRWLAAELEGLFIASEVALFDEVDVSGITDIRALGERRMDRQRERDAQLSARYCAEFKPKVEELYEYARVRGFFHPDLERYYWTQFPFVAEQIPALLRAVADAQ
jgi:hypothetical protein